MHDYNKIAGIVGEDKVQALRDAGVDIADKPTKPTTDLFGRWAKHPDFGDVVIVDNVTIGSYVMVMCRDTLNAAGTSRKHVKLSDLMFPEETTRPEDVPVGEAWLVTLDDGEYSAERINAVKLDGNKWVIGSRENIAKIWKNREVTLIAPLIPARPQDVDRGESPEAVTTQEEYESLPVGSIVARDNGDPYVKVARSKWKSINNSTRTNVEMGGVRQVRQVLRRGWAKSHTAHHAEQAGQSNGNA